jgi:N-acetylmuramoyl-L-alanine amidase
VRVVVLDAGHGGGDPGVRAGGLAEKDLTLALARRLRDELGSRGLTHVLLTRDDDRTLSNDQRAEYANHARADLYLSLHVDGFTSPQARGITILCPPARFGGTPLPPPPRVAPISVMPWRDVAERHAVQSLALAEVLRSTLELNGLGPVRLREMLPTTLIGVDATGLMIECGELTSSAERARLADPAALARMAALIADGVRAWERSE